MAYLFTRANGDYLSFPHLTVLDADQTVSLSVWVYPGATGTPVYDRVVNLKAAAGGYGWSVERYSSAEQQFEVSRAANTTTTTARLSGITALTLEAWQHLFVAIDTSTTGEICRAWIDGVEHTGWVNSVTGPLTMGTNTAPFLIGNSKTDGTGRTWEGALAEVALWSDTITDEPTIQALAAGRLPTAQTTYLSSLRFYAPLRSEATDVVGGLTGTVSGASVTTHPATVDVYAVTRLSRRPWVSVVWRPGVARRTV